MEETLQYVPLTNDMMFHRVFTQNEAAMRGLLSALLQIPRDKIGPIYILNTIQYGEALEDQLTVLDLNLLLADGRKILVEMQVRRVPAWAPRCLLYASRGIAGQMHPSEEGENARYDVLKPIVQISIMLHALYPENRRLLSTCSILDEQTGYPFTDLMKFIVLDLTALDCATEADEQSGLADWVRAFNARQWSEIDALANNDESIREAVKVMRVVMSDEDERYLITRRQLAEMDRLSELDLAKEEGKAEGEARGEARGRAEGEALGTLKTLIALVKDKLLSLPEAARRANLSEEAFRAQMAG